MSEQETELDTELEEASDDLESTQSALETEESEETLDETVNEKEVQRQKSAQGQIDKAQQLLDKGEEIPESLKWTLKHIQPKEAKPDDIKSTLKEMLAEERDAETFSKLEKELKGLGLNKEEFAKVKSKYQLYQSRGFKKGEALNEALELFSDKRNKDNSKKKTAASIPAAGTEDEEELSFDNLSSLSKDQKWKLFKQAATK